MSEAINGSSPQGDAPSAPFQPQGIMAHTRFDHGATASPASVIRYARRYRGSLAGLVIAAVAMGVAYRYLFDPLEERVLSYYLRSCVHAIGLAISGWAVLSLAAAPQSRLRLMLRRLPQTAELAIKALAMTVVLTIAAVGLQLVLYPAPFFLQHWVVHELPSILAIAFSASVVAGAIFEFRRLIGGRVLGSFLLGTYHRPKRQQRIVIFLDIAGSTALAEQLGEVRVHDLITRFFFDIDRPIADHDGEVHAYVGDEVIITWPLSDDPKRNARSLRCFSAAEDRIVDLAPHYTCEFGIAPQFRADVHAGPVVVSECGDTKRQIAYFGDTMNVAARLCDYSKTAGEALVASADMLTGTAIPPGLSVGSPTNLTLRGRQTPVEAHAVRHNHEVCRRAVHAPTPD